MTDEIKMEDYIRGLQAALGKETYSKWAYELTQVDPDRRRDILGLIGVGFSVYEALDQTKLR